MSPTLTRPPSLPLSPPAIDRILREVSEYPCQVTIPWSAGSPFQWIAAQPPGAKLIWTDREDRSTVAGWGAAAMIDRRAGESTSSVLQRCRTELGRCSSARMYGGFRFDDMRDMASEWEAFGPGRFWLPRITYDGHSFRLVVLDRQDVEQARSAWMASLREPLVQRQPLPTSGGHVDEPSYGEWEALLHECDRLFAAEILEKIVLVRRRRLELDRPLCPYQLLERLVRTNAHSYAFCFQPDELTSFVGISPERLVARSGDEIQTEVLAGTRPRGQDRSSDQALAAELQSSAKEQLEHDIVRKSICQRLHGVVDNLQVDANARLLTLPSMQHLYSSVRGHRKKDTEDGTFIDRLHPTPALGGYPTDNALVEIRRMEQFDRGWYGAPVGWISSDAMEFAVGIRSALIRSQGVSLFSGAGIVPGSTADGEWLELDQKVRDYMHLLTPKVFADAAPESSST